jgi:hypothetical protein
MARPNPVVPPITTATLPVKSKRLWLIAVFLSREFSAAAA